MPDVFTPWHYFTLFYMSAQMLSLHLFLDEAFPLNIAVGVSSNTFHSMYCKDFSVHAIAHLKE
jgi:hypothetical protein